MIFNARQHGWKAKDFHEYCDGKGPTVSFIQVKNGPCIGGFTTASWKGIEESKFISDRYSFLFNLTDEVHIPIKYSEQGIAWHGDNGPTYGNGDLVVFSRFNESDHLRAMPEKKPFFVEKRNGKNILTNSSNERNTTVDFEMWQVKFTEAFQNEYCMQWLDDKHVNQAE